MDYVALAVEVAPRVGVTRQRALPAYDLTPGYCFESAWEFRPVTLANGDAWMIGQRLDKLGEEIAWPIRVDADKPVECRHYNIMLLCG